MYAVKAMEFPLLEHVLWLCQGEDVDVQNIAGDTALTLACHLGKLDYVELLVQNGADVNLETFSGRTPLIEATKTGSITVVDYLIRCGAQVTYCTRKHAKGAISWARQMRAVDLLRALELGSIVQSQVGVLFRAIGSGDLAHIKAIIGDGEPFAFNNIALFYQEMER